MSKPEPLSNDQIYLGDFLLKRLEQIGVATMFGVPGDFNLTFLDLVESNPNIDWVGCCNELNAGYAADGYSRIKQNQLNALTADGQHKTQGGVRGLSALLTTFGVGELSAINAIAGAYSERVPIVHIVGVPSTKLQDKGALLHHTLGDNTFNAYETATRPFTKAQAFLKGPRDAAQEIDRVLKVAIETAHPTYLSLPTDLVFHPVPKSLLDTPVIPETPVGVDDKNTLPTGEEIDSEGQRMVNFVKDEIVRLWDQAKNPAILVDACAMRYGVEHLVQDLVTATGANYFSTPLGKGALPEDPAKGFGGVYIGDLTDKDVKDAFESADLVINVGSLPSDFNTGEFTAQRPKEITIELHSDHTKVQFATYPDISFHTLLPLLTTSLTKKDSVPAPKDAGLVKKIPDGAKDEMVKQEAFWPLMGTFFKEDDIILAETGTSSFGLIDVPVPKGSSVLSQVLYGSIGWATPATLGAAVAAKEAGKPRRTILFTGDGSLQLTVQDISTMIRQGLKPILVVLNNESYVIEKVIHGPEATYNKIALWDWQKLLSVFDSEGLRTKSWKASTRGELEDILANHDFAKADKLQLLEVRMGPLDAPRALIEQAKLTAQLNSA